MTFENKKELFRIFKADVLDKRSMDIGLELFLTISIPTLLVMILRQLFFTENIWIDYTINAIRIICFIFLASFKAKQRFRLYVSSTFWWSVLWRVVLAELVLLVIPLYIIILTGALLVGPTVGILAGLVWVIFASIVADGWAATRAFWHSAKHVPDEEMLFYEEEDVFWPGQESYGDKDYDPRNITRKLDEFEEVLV